VASSGNDGDASDVSGASHGTAGTDTGCDSGGGGGGASGSVGDSGAGGGSGGGDRILVLRPNALGDFMFALPALHALRGRYPQARIILLGKPWHADFLGGRPGPVDEVIVMPPLPGLGAPPGSPIDATDLQNLVDQLRGLRPTIAAQMYGGGRYSNPFIASLGAGLTIGAATPDAAPLDRSIHYSERANRRLELLQIAALADAQPRLLPRELEVTTADRLLAERALPVTTDERLVVLHPGASDARRRWPAERFAAVADALADAGAAIAISASADEAPLAYEIATRMRHGAANLAGALPLPALCGLLERSRMIVSNDTGPLHMALALGKPAVGVFWLTNMIESCPLAQHLLRPALSLRTRCPVCGAENLRTRCPHDVSFVDDVDAGAVTALALDLWREVG
jgi:ADP-heptose:LPS heptosyltransferase